jgi:putative oxidoreductase
MAILISSGKYINFGLLILRLGLGAIFIFHGIPILKGGQGKWKSIGSAMIEVGIDSYLTIWGLLSALVEVGGGLLIISGFLFKPASFSLFMVMIIAANLHLSQNQGFASASYPISLGIVMFAFLFTGPGKFSIDNFLLNKNRK